MSGIISILRDLYIRFLVWLGAAPPEGFEHLAPTEIALPAEYTLKEGETIFAVARRFGVHYDLIARANNIEDYKSIQPGQTLTIPSPDWTPDSGPLAEPEAQPEPEPILEPTPPVKPLPPQEPRAEPELPPAEPEAVEEIEWLTAAGPISGQTELAIDEVLTTATEESALEDVEWLVAAEPIEAVEPEPAVDEISATGEEEADFGDFDWLAAEEQEESVPEDLDWLAAEEAAEADEIEPASDEISTTGEDESALEDFDWLAAEEPDEAIEPEPEVDIPSPVQELLSEFEAEPPQEEIFESSEAEPEPAIETQTVEEEGVPVPPESEMVFRYEVQRGDTLSAIARRYGLTLKDLVEANDIADPSLIFPGQKIIVPGYMSPKPEPGPETQLPPPPVDAGEHFVYTVVSGDTLSAIAKRYGITLRELIEANTIDDPNLIRIGQKLVIPGIMRPTEPPAAPEPEPTPEPAPQPEPEPEPVIPPQPDTGPGFPPIGTVSAVRAMYMSYFAVGHSKFRQRIFELLDTTELNAVVIDAKGDFGWISYPTQISLAREIGAARPTAKDFNELLSQLKERGVYTIARVVTFKDNPLAKNQPELAVKTASGTLWQDREQLCWTDPFLRPVWDYNIQIAVEAARMGFDEIQFDYIRFPTPSQAGVPHFSQEVTKGTRVAAITGFLSAARGHLNPLGVKVAADTFGYTCWREDDTVIGQDIDRMGQYLDVLCPMLYPSTFGSGIPGYKFAVAYPYEIVYHSAIRAVERLKALGCNVRPWIQDFPDYRFDKRVYGKEEIQAQIKGCFDSGSAGFMVWDPRVQYTDGAYAPVREPA